MSISSRGDDQATPVGMSRASKHPRLTFNGWLRFSHIRLLLAEVPSVETVVEVGVGQGAMAQWLADRYQYLGFEPDPVSYATAAAALKRRGRGRLINAALPAPSRAVDALVAFEVLEHIEDDRRALTEWAKWLRPGGAIILSVPARPDRFGPWDEHVGHYRRYTREGLEQLLRDAGASEVVVWTYGFPLGYALEFVRNRIASHSTPLDKKEATAASGRRLQLEQRSAWIARWVTAPFRLLQRPFRHTSLGTGLVARAVIPQ